LSILESGSQLRHRWLIAHYSDHLNGVTDFLDDESGELLANPGFRLIPQSLSKRRIGKPQRDRWSIDRGVQTIWTVYPLTFPADARPFLPTKCHDITTFRAIN
jgi:hypothetical protein